MRCSKCLFVLSAAAVYPAVAAQTKIIESPELDAWAMLGGGLALLLLGRAVRAVSNRHRSAASSALHPPADVTRSH
ncbi:MAG: hypothetical protein R2748_30265 [Bryobacterales bacterium]